MELKFKDRTIHLDMTEKEFLELLSPAPWRWERKENWSPESEQVTFGNPPD